MIDATILGRSVLFQEIRLLEELSQSDARLIPLMLWAADYAIELGYQVIVTSVARDRTRTMELYAASRQSPPSGGSPHDVRPCRALDLDLLPLPAVEQRMTAAGAGLEIEKRIRARSVYPRGKHAALWHDVSGDHLHLQVPPDTLSLSA